MKNVFCRKPLRLIKKPNKLDYHHNNYDQNKQVSSLCLDAYSGDRHILISNIDYSNKKDIDQYVSYLNNLNGTYKDSIIKDVIKKETFKSFLIVINDFYMKYNNITDDEELD